jgi:hypothetical protein
VRFLEPGFGTGPFFSALLENLPSRRLHAATAFEVDPRCGDSAAELWSGTSLHLRIEDFTLAMPPVSEGDKPNLIVCNPPYVRNQHIPSADKRRLRQLSADATGIDVSPLAGLHTHFLLLAHAWLAADGIGAWLLPGELLDVDHGAAVRTYLTEMVTLLRAHRFEPRDLQFDDPNVSSFVAWFRNRRPAPDHVVEITTGGMVSDPHRRERRPLAELAGGGKWNGGGRAVGRASGAPTLDDLFTIKRGIATGANGFFIVPEERAKELGLPLEFLRPILPAPRRLAVDEVLADEKGHPLVEPRLLLVDCHLTIGEIEAQHTAL